MMDEMIDDDLWAKHQYQVLAGFVHHLAYYRVLSQIYSGMNSKSEFWTRTIDAHLLRAVIDWCMVFGTDSNEIHWKRVVSTKSAQAKFRKHLFTATGMTGAQWKSYWLLMTKFRNNYAAHKTTQGTYPPVPLMDMALRVAYAYDDWFRETVQALFSDPSLRRRYERLFRTSKQPLTQAVGMGPWLEVEYEGRPPRKQS
ncbi:MAG: hypothetical protein Q8S00_18555 [Deltaproteobacteria bacterium]|nr:hypothetical protein [Deltaproteobacteria bacterium]